MLNMRAASYFKEKEAEKLPSECLFKLKCIWLRYFTPKLKTTNFGTYISDILISDKKMSDLQNAVIVELAENPWTYEELIYPKFELSEIFRF